MFGFHSFSEAPFSALALNNYQLVCNAGSYTLTGGDATFAYTKAVSGNAGTYNLTGQNADLTYNQKLLADAGSYNLTGNSATFVHNQVIYAGAFSFLLTGQNAGLLQNKIINGQPGAYSLTGGAATFARNRIFSVSAGSYAYSGKDATLDYKPNIVEIISKGGLPKEKKKRREEKESREQLEAIVKREFDILDGTYVPEVAESAKQAVLPQIKEIDYTQHQIALAQVNALLLQAKIRAAEYESELDDEEALLMLL